LLQLKSTQPTAEVSHALGQFYLAESRFDDAIAELDEALKTEPKNAILLNDLGAAWLEKGKLQPDGSGPGDADRGKSMEALGQSLTQLNRALTEDKNLLEAIFNRALCFQYLRLPVRAQEEWHEYLKKDSTSQWAQEVRQNLNLVDEQVNRSAQTKEQMLDDFLNAQEKKDDEKAWRLISVTRDDLSGTNIPQQLLDRYLAFATSGKPEEASNQLQALSYVGELEVKRADEHYNSDLAALFQRLTPTQKATVAKARELMKTGYKMYEQSADTKAMLDVFIQAAQGFAQAGDRVEVNHAKFWIAYGSLTGLDTKRGLAALTELASNCTKLRYRWLLMRTTQSISTAKYNLKEYSNSIDYSLQALGQAEQLGDDIGAFNAFDSLTEVYRSINNYPRAMNSISRSQPLLDCCAINPIKVWRHYSIVAVAFYSVGSYAAAIEYQREALRRALISKDPDMVCVSYAHLGLMYGKLGNYDEALKSAKFGYETAASRGSESKEQGLMAYSSLQIGHLYRELGDCENAIKNYDESIALYKSLGLPAHIYQAHKGRLVCYINEKNYSLAGKELETTLNLIDNNRTTIFENDNRNKFFDVEQNIYDLGIGYTYDTEKDAQKAFAYSEASRGRSLLDLLLGGNVKSNRKDQESKEVFFPLPLSEIQRNLPPANQIVEYTVLDDKTLIWVITQRDFQVKEARISRNELEGLVQNYLRLVSDPRSDLTKESRQLFDLLIRPVEPLLDPKSQLNFVPDKFLNSLPFDSLISTTSNRFLIENYCISYAPSATVFVLASKNAGSVDPTRPEQILSVGNPRFDRDFYRFLPDLKDAAREATQVRASYERGEILVGPGATKQRVLAEIRDSDVAHFALHSIEEKYAEMHSRLVLAKEPQGNDLANDVLEASEIYELSLPKTRLVVLSACQTGTGRYYGGEGTFSLARAFLVSGVPVVVASLWPVDSASTADLMISFHRSRKEQRLSAAEALKRSQLEMLNARDGKLHHPYYWAAFSVLGGSEMH
jgi:CHAT domain-containing protein